MKNRILFWVVIAFLFGVPVQAATEVEIDVKPSFSAGEEIEFKYTIFSSEGGTIEYAPVIECENIPAAPLSIETETLTPEQTVQKSHHHGPVLEQYEAQNCTANVVLLKPYKMTITKEFLIRTEPTFSFSVLTDKSVYLKGETAIIDYSSEIAGIEAVAKLTYPDSSVRQITLPASINVQQSGTYTLESSASKEGYRTVYEVKQFGVIDNQAIVRPESRCNANGFCENREDFHNCPQDCPGALRIGTDNYLLIFIAIVSVFLGAIGLTIKKRSLKRKENIPPQL